MIQTSVHPKLNLEVWQHRASLHWNDKFDATQI